MQHEILDRIKRTRFRILVRRTASHAASALFVAALVVAIVGGFEYVWGSAPLTSAVLVALCIVVSMGAATIGLATGPTLASVALKIDRHYEYSECLTTAVQVIGTEGTTPMAHTDPREVEAQEQTRVALLRTATLRARSVSPKVLAPVSPSLLWAVVALLALLLSLQLRDWLSHDADSPTLAAATTSTASLTGDEVAERIELLAMSLSEVAEKREQDHLQAASYALWDLAERTRSGELGQEELESELSGLVEHVARALGLVDVPSQSLAHALTFERRDVLGSVMERLGLDASDSTNAQAGLEQLTSRTEGGGERDTPTDSALSQVPSESDGIRAQAIVYPDYDPANNPWAYEAFIAIDPNFNYAPDATAQVGGGPRQVVDDVTVAGSPGGSGSGASEEAGNGSPGLSSGEGELTDVGLPQVDLQLPNGEAVERRIRVDMPPVMSRSDVAESTMDSTGDWRFEPEAAVDSSFVEAQDRPVVSRYFILLRDTTLGFESP